MNRLASLLLGLVLLAGGGLVAVETLLAVSGLRSLLIDRPAWYAALRATPLDDPLVRTVATSLLLLGVVVLVAELRRWQPERIALPGRDGWHLHRRSMERRLTDVAQDVPGMQRARVALRRHGVTWRPRVVATGDPTSRPALETALGRELERLGTPLAVRIELGQSRRRHRRRA